MQKPTSVPLAVSVGYVTKELLNLKGQVKTNTSEIKEIRQELRDLTQAVRQLANAIQQDRNNNAHQQEMMVEKLKNALLQFENNLLKGQYPNMLGDSKDKD